MVELTQAVLSVLQAAGLHAAASHALNLSPRLKHSAVAVEVETLESTPGGFSAYLGLSEGRELYGMRLSARLRLDVYSPVSMGASECRRVLDQAAGALSLGVAGVSILQVTCHAPAYDPVGDRFAAQLLVDCRCWLCETTQPESPGSLTHFILKGALA